MGTSENITDKKRFEELFGIYFVKYNVFLKSSGININVKYNKYENDIIEIQMNEPVEVAENSIIFARCDNKLVCANVKFLSIKDNDNYQFQPKNIEIIEIERKEERKKISDNDNEKKLIYITNIISDFILKDCLNYEKKKVEFIKDKLVSKLGKAYPYSKAFFFNENKNDDRMKYFFQERKPIFISDIKKEVLKTDEIKMYEFYKMYIFDRDNFLDWNKIISEISLPIFYKSLLPFGYLQINSDKPFTEDEFNTFKKLGGSTSEFFTKNNVIKTSDDKIIVADLSKSGLGVVFKERTLIKHFKDNSYLFFNITLPENKVASVLSIVKNINLIGNKIFRIGCEIVEIDALGQCHYDEYLENK
jgi:hypothetical protein